jgi:glutaredoxin
MLDSSGQIIDSGFSIKDTNPASSTILWSSGKIDDSYIRKTQPIIQNSLLVKTPDGNLQENSIVIDDSKPTGVNILWTSDKNSETFLKKISGNSTFPLLSTNGQLIDSGISVNNFVQKTIPSSLGSFTTLDSSGQIVDSGFSIQDTNPASSTNLWSSEKITKSFPFQVTNSINLAQLGLDGQLHDSGLNPTNVMQKTIPKENGSIAFLDATGQVSDSGFVVQDNQSGLDVLWSTTKNNETFMKKLSGNSTFPLLNIDGQLIDSNVNVSNVMLKSVPTADKSVAILNSFGQIVDSGFSIQDTNPASSTNLWSSQKITKSFPFQVTNSINLAQLGLDGQLHDSGLNPTNVMQKTIPKENGSIAFLDATGQVSDSGFVVQDNQSGLDVLWSTTKNNETFMKKLSGNSTFPLLNIDGQLIDSNVNVSNVMLKSVPTADKSVAILNSFGQIVDSGFSIQDTNPASSTNLWSSQKIDDNYIRKTAPIIQNSLLIKSQDGNLKENSIIIDDSKPASANVVWTSNKVQQNFITLPTPNTDGNVLQYDSTGKIISAKPYKMTIFPSLDNAWYFHPDMYIGVMITKPTATQYNVLLSSNVNFNPVHTYHLTAHWTSGPTNGTVTKLHKKLSGNIPFNTTGTLNINTQGTPTTWLFVADDKLEILFVDRTNRAIFKIMCIFTGFSAVSHIVSIEQLN